MEHSPKQSKHSTLSETEMSPRYVYDPSKVSSSIEIFPKNDYEFIIGEPKAFKGANQQGQENFGVRVALTHAEGEFRGKKTVYTMYMHSEGAQSMAKRFHIAAYGFPQNGQNLAQGEQAFNEAHGGDDWSFDPDTGSVGDAWAKMAGGRIIGSLDVKKNNKDDSPQQDFKSWRPAIVG